MDSFVSHVIMSTTLLLLLLLFVYYSVADSANVTFDIKIKLNYSNTSCGVDEITKYVCT